MKHCSKCHSEYVDDVSACSDCGGALRDGRLPIEHAREIWVPVRTVSRDTEAALIEGFLRAEGLRVAIENARSHPLPETFGDLAEIRILVPEDSRDQADSVLAARVEEYRRALEEEGDGDDEDGDDEEE